MSDSDAMQCSHILTSRRRKHTLNSFGFVTVIRKQFISSENKQITESWEGHACKHTEQEDTEKYTLSLSPGSLSLLEMMNNGNAECFIYRESLSLLCLDCQCLTALSVHLSKLFFCSLHLVLSVSKLSL